MNAKTYVGTKTVIAEPMTRAEYNAYRGWTVPVDENPNDPGYLVEYVDGGKANMPDRNGYVSWSPADVFERAYRPVHGDATERAIVDKGLTAPRVTPADIEAAIASEHYFNAHEAAMQTGHVVVGPASALAIAAMPEESPLALLTFCVLVLDNGFTVTGYSACASPENFDAEIGKSIARNKAIVQVWPLLGFRLRDKLAAQ